MRGDKAAQRRRDNTNETEAKEGDESAMQREMERGRMRSTDFLLDAVGALLFWM